MTQRAIVLLSGGLDSATVLAMARAEGFETYALSVRYGQRHVSEIAAAQRVAQHLQVARHEIIDLDLRKFGGSALTDDAFDVPTSGVDAGIPITYVPARNTIMLSLALGWAEAVGAQDIFFGANAVDYSGYPDCRPAYVAAFQEMATLATKAGIEGQTLRINAPIISLNKAEIIQAGMRLGVDFSLTISCYQANAEGEACGICDSCRIRRAGFAAAGVPDVTRYTAKWRTEHGAAS